MFPLTWRRHGERRAVLGWLSGCLADTYVTGDESGSETRRWYSEKSGQTRRKEDVLVFLFILPVCVCVCTCRFLVTPKGSRVLLIGTN